MPVSSRSRSCMASLQVLTLDGSCYKQSRGADAIFRWRHWLLPSLYCSSLAPRAHRFSPWFRALCCVVLYVDWSTPLWEYVLVLCSMGHRLTPFTALLDHGIPSSMYFSSGLFCGGFMIIGALFILLAKLSIDRQLFKVI